MKKKHIIDVSNLSFSYPDGTQALHDVTFSIPEGASCAIIGPNGAGKSTLLTHLNGYLLPQSGEVRVAGLSLTAESAATIRRSVGVVFQDPDDQLFMPSVFDDVAFGPVNAGFSKEQVEALTYAALEQVGMSHLRDRPPYRLSAGEKRSVTIATALALSPDVLIMDEPSSNLDPRSRRRLADLLKSFNHTKIIATHDLELVVEVCSGVIILDGGRVIAQGSAVDLMNDESLMLAHGLERPHILRHLHPH